MNFADTYRRSGVHPLEYTLVGPEGTGQIAEVSEDIESWQAGDRVAWHEGQGSHATPLVVISDFILHMPVGTPAEETAAMPLQGLTAQYLAADSH